MRCSVVFGVTLRLLVINISSSSPIINTAAYCQRCVITCGVVHSTGDPVDNTLHVAALTASIKARYRLRIAISAYPICIRRPRYGCRSRSIAIVWYANTKMVWIPDGEKSPRIWVLDLTECTNVTDTHTHTHGDTHTASWQCIGRAYIASHEKNHHGIMQRRSTEQCSTVDIITNFKMLVSQSVDVSSLETVCSTTVKCC